MRQTDGVPATVPPDPPAFDHERFGSALEATVAWHGTQVRKTDGIPYLSHLLTVAGLVLEDGGTTDTAIAALLHDSIEDQGVTIDELTDRFGPLVARTVALCSDSGTAESVDGPYRARKLAHVRKLQTLVRSPGDDPVEAVLTVSAADKLANLRSMNDAAELHGEDFWDDLTGGAVAMHWYYRALAPLCARLAEHRPSRLVHGLESELARLDRIVAGYGDPAPAASLGSALAVEDPLGIGDREDVDWDVADEYRLLTREALRRARRHNGGDLADVAVSLADAWYEPGEDALERLGAATSRSGVRQDGA